MSRSLMQSGTLSLFPIDLQRPPGYCCRMRSAQVSERVIPRSYRRALVPLTKLSLPVLEAKQARMDTTSPLWV
jgi:hypothetical protein